MKEKYPMLNFIEGHHVQLEGEEKILSLFLFEQFIHWFTNESAGANVRLFSPSRSHQD